MKKKTSTNVRPHRAPRTIASSVDAYLQTLPDEQREALEKIRQAVHAAAPAAEECVSYGLPAFRLNGRPLVAFGASAGHCSFYPMSGVTIEAHRKALEKYETSKGTIRFQPARPLPASLIKRLVRARMAETEG